MVTAKVITVSDRSYRGEREDAGGPAVKALLERAGYTVGEIVLVPDERGCIEKELIRAADEENIALIVTTGGTGFAERDVTPEATIAVCGKTRAGYSRGNEGGVHADHAEGMPVARGGRHPGEESDRQSARQSEGGVRKPGSGAGASGTRDFHPPRRKGIKFSCQQRADLPPIQRPAAEGEEGSSRDGGCSP